MAPHLMNQIPTSYHTFMPELGPRLLLATKHSLPRMALPKSLSSLHQAIRLKFVCMHCPLLSKANIPAPNNKRSPNQEKCAYPSMKFPKLNGAGWMRNNSMSFVFTTPI